MKEFYKDAQLYGEVWKYFAAGIGMFAVGCCIKMLKLSIILSILVTVPVCMILYFALLYILKAELLESVKEIVKRLKRH